MCSVHSLTLLFRSQQVRKTLLSQRHGSPESYYNPKSFLEPVQARQLHCSEIPSVLKVSTDEVQVLEVPPKSCRTLTTKPHPTLAALFTQNSKQQTNACPSEQKPIGLSSDIPTAPVQSAKSTIDIPQASTDDHPTLSSGIPDAPATHSSQSYSDVPPQPLLQTPSGAPNFFQIFKLHLSPIYHPSITHLSPDLSPPSPANPLPDLSPPSDQSSSNHSSPAHHTSAFAHPTSPSSGNSSSNHSPPSSPAPTTSPADNPLGSPGSSSGHSLHAHSPLPLSPPPKQGDHREQPSRRPCSWEDLDAGLQSVLPPNEKYSYVKKLFKNKRQS